MQDLGWGAWCTGNAVAGTTGESRRIEAIQFKSSRNMRAQGGTTGKSLRLEAFKFSFI